MPEDNVYWICCDYVVGLCKWNKEGCQIDHPNIGKHYADAFLNGKPIRCERENGTVPVKIMKVEENMVIPKK